MKNNNYSEIINILKGPLPYSHSTSKCFVTRPHLEWLGKYIKNLENAKMIECGVAKGGCIAFCHKVNPNLNIFALDSWDIIPEEVTNNDAPHCHNYVGTKWGDISDIEETYNLIGASTENLTLIKGYFEDTIPDNINLFNDIDILRLDCDYYEPIMYCLESLYDSVKSGGIIILDDWHFNPKGVQGAVYDFLNRRNIKVVIDSHDPCCVNKSFGFGINKTLCNLGHGRGPAYFIKP